MVAKFRSMDLSGSALNRVGVMRSEERPPGPVKVEDKAKYWK
jgi:hypothetical protein